MPPNEQQAEAWNGSESVYFVDNAGRYDFQLEPFAELFSNALCRRRTRSCSTSAAVRCDDARGRRQSGACNRDRPVETARGVGPARARAAGIENADFVIADAQTHELAPGAFDLLISQFGLMFFDDPLGALSNLGGALRPGGRLVFVCWQGLPANEWLRLIGDAVGRHVDLPEFGRQVRGPGIFSLCDAEETTALLNAAGFEHVECESCAPTILIGGGGSLVESIDFLLGMGMARGLVSLVDPSDRDDVIRAVSADLKGRYEEGVGTRPVLQRGW